KASATSTSVGTPKLCSRESDSWPRSVDRKPRSGLVGNLLAKSLLLEGRSIADFAVAHPCELLQDKPVVRGRWLLFFGIKRVPLRAAHLDAANRTVCIAEVHHTRVFAAELVIVRVLDRQARQSRQ